MGFFKEKIKDYFLLDTPVENMFINEYMQMAPGDYVKVYLVGLMYAGLEESITNEAIARQLNMEPEDVLKAWTWWEKAGIIRKHMKGSESGFDYDVEFVVLKEQLYGDKSQPAPVRRSLSDMMSDPQIKSMIAEVEKSSGRIFSSTDLQEIQTWIEEYQVQPELIAYAFQYCARKKKTDVRYVGKVVQDWGSRGLRTAAKAEEFLAGIDKKNTRNRRIFRALGFSRNATEEEERIMDHWFDEMHLSMETVLSACARTSGITSPNINYVNKVLIAWQKEGNVKTAGRENAPSAKEIRQYYELLRRRDEQQAEDRRQEVYRRVPRIREIDDELTAANSELGRVIITDTVDRKKTTRRIRQQMEDLNTEKAFLLTENGYELDHMEIRYECPHCKDTGILDTGEKCQCFTAVTNDRIRQITEQIKQ